MLIGAAKRDTSMWLIATSVLARETSPRFLILREAPTRGTHLALLRWSAARKTGAIAQGRPPLPWSDGTTEPNGRRSNFSHKNCPRKRPAADGGAAVVAILGQR